MRFVCAFSDVFRYLLYVFPCGLECVLLRGFRIRLGAVFVRVYGLGFDDAFLVRRCCFISVFPPPEEALFLYVWNFKGVWVQVCVCLT